MAVVSSEIRFAPQLTAWFAANPTKVLQDGEIVYCSDGANIGKYVIGDNSTQLSALTFYGGASSSGLTIGTTTITSGTNTRILYNNNGVVGEYLVTGTGTTAVLSTSPTFTTDITTPLIIGGTGVGSLITYKGSTNATPTLTGIAHTFYVGNNGADEALRILHNGRIGLNTNPSYDSCVNGHDTANDGILISSGTYVNLPLPGTVTNTTLITGRGFNMATDSTVLTGSYVPTLGIGLASNRSGGLIGIKNTASNGYSILIEDGNMGVFTTNPYTQLQVAGDITTTWANSNIGTWYQDGTSYKMGFNTVIANRQLNLHAYTADTGGYITFSTGTVASPFVNLIINPAQTSGALVNYDFTNPTSTNLTLSTNIPNFKVTGSTKQWATGALATQYFNHFTSNTVSFVGASTATLVGNNVFEYAQGGTNATITTSAAIYVPTLALTNTTLGVGLNIEAPSGATTNWAIRTIGAIRQTIGTGNIQLSQLPSNANVGVLYLNQATPSDTNYTIASTNASTTYLNGVAATQISVNANLVAYYNSYSARWEGGSYSGLVGSDLWWCTAGAGVNLTASTELTSYSFNSTTHQYLAGALTTLRKFRIKPDTISFSSASTITNSYSLYVEASTAGTNATITNNYAAGFSGNVNILSGSLYNTGTKVVGTRETGYTAFTNTTNKATAYDTATITLIQLAERVAAMQASMTTHGLIGA